MGSPWPTTAVDSFEKILRVNPEDKNVWYSQGTAFEKMRDYDNALRCYDKAIGLDADDKFAWNSKGIVLLETNKFENAVRCFEKALELDKGFAPATACESPTRK